MIRQLFLLLSLVTFLSVSSKAQGDNVPKEVKETFTSQYPSAEDVVYKDNLLTVWVNFTMNGEKYAANYTKKGQWKNTEKEWAFEKLPDKVKDGFQKSKYADWKVEETKMIYRAGGTEWYRVKVRKNDVQKKFLYFNKDGQLVDDALTVG